MSVSFFKNNFSNKVMDLLIVNNKMDQ